MIVHIMQIISEDPQGVYYGNSSILYVDDSKLPIFERQQHTGWREWTPKSIGPVNFWVVTSDCCKGLPKGTVCRLFTNDNEEIGKQPK